MRLVQLITLKTFVAAIFTLSVICNQNGLSQSIETFQVLKGSYFNLNYSVNGNIVSGVKDIKTDPDGFVYVCGLAYNAPVTAGAYQTTIAGSHDAFVCKFSADLSTIIWCTFIGGADQDVATRLVVNSAKEVIVKVFTGSSNFPISNAGDQQYLSNFGAGSEVICKLSANGSQLLWSRAIAAQSIYGKDYLDDLTLNGSGGSIYTLTSMTGSNAQITSNAYQSTAPPGVNILLTKLSDDGTITYSSYIGGSLDDMGYGICCAAGKVMINGRTTSSNFPLASGKTPDAVYGDAFVMAWTDAATPTPLASLIFGGSRSEHCRVVHYNPATGSFLHIGQTDSDDFPYTNTLMAGQTKGGFVASISPDLANVQYMTIVGISVLCDDIVCRQNGSYFVSGHLNSQNAPIPITTGCIRSTPNGPGCGLLVGVNSQGSTVTYGSYLNYGITSNDYLLCALRELSNCSYRLVLSPDMSGYGNQNQFLVTSGTYMTTPQVGLVYILSNAHPDTARIVPTATCGEYTFDAYTTGTAPYAALSVTWSFGDGSALQSGSSVVHKYSGNGVFNVLMRVAYPGGDTSYFNKTLNVSSQPTIKAAPHTLYRCSNDSGVVITASGGVRYEWHPGASLSDSTSARPIAKPTQSRMRYFLRGYDASGCYADDTVDVYVTSINPRLSASDSVLCEGRSLTLRASGGGSFKWLPSTTLKGAKDTAVVNPTKTSTYKVIVSDGSCSDTASMTIYVAHKPTIILPAAPSICTGGNTELLAQLSGDVFDTMGVRWSWSPSSGLSSTTARSPNAAPTKTTTYTCTATNAFGCVATASVQVKVQTALNLVLTTDTVLCRGTSTTLRASGGALYSWSPRSGLSDTTSSAPVCNAQQTTIYRVVTWSGNYTTASCRDTAYVTVRVIDLPQLSAGADTVVCPGDNVVLRARSQDSAVRFAWYDQSGTLLSTTAVYTGSCSQSTTFVAQALNSAGCTSTDTIAVKVDPLLISVKAVSSALLVKPGTVVHLGVAARDTSLLYQWTGSNGTIIAKRDSLSFVIDTTQTFVVRAARGGCSALDSVTIIVSSTAPVRVQAASDTVICEGQFAELYIVRGDSTLSYEWRDSLGSILSHQAHALVQVAKSSRFIVRASDGTSTSFDTMEVSVRAAPLARARDRSMCRGQSTTLQPDTIQPTVRYEWLNMDGSTRTNSDTLTVAPLLNTSYLLRATSPIGCSSIDTVTVVVTPATRVQFGLDALYPGDKLMAGDSVTIRISAFSDQTLLTDSVQYTLRVSGTMLHLQDADYESGAMVRHFSRAVGLSPQVQYLDTVRALVLTTQDRSSLMQIDSIRVFPSPCISIDTSSSSRLLVTDAVCANYTRTIRLQSFELSLTPNPAGDQFGIAANGTIEEIRFDNILGRCIDSLVPTTGAQMYQFSTATLESGVYLIHVRIEGVWITSELMVVR